MTIQKPLSAKHLQLLNSIPKPEIDPAFEHMGVSWILEHETGANINGELQGIAERMLDEGRVEEAWQVILRCTNP